MDNHDRENLNFILTRTQDQLLEWFQTIQDDQDEMDYAMELILQAKSLIELELLDMTDHDAEQDVSLASNYLQRFRLP